MSCENEYFLDSGCTLPMILPLLWLLGTVISFIVYYIYGNKAHVFGPVFLIYSLSCVFIAAPTSIFIRQLAYIMETQAGYFRYFVIFVAICSFFLSLLTPYYFIGIHLGFLTIVTAVAVFGPYDLLKQPYKSAKVEDGSVDEEIPLAVVVDDEELTKEEIEDAKIQAQEDEEHYTKLMAYSKYALIFDWVMFVIYTCVYYFQKPYGTYIVFCVAVLPRFVIFVQDLLYGLSNTPTKLKLGLYILSDIFIALFYVVPLRFLIIVVDVLDKEVEESVPIYKSKWLWKRIVFFGVFLYLLLMCIFFFKSVVLVSYAVISVLAYIWYYMQFQVTLQRHEERTKDLLEEFNNDDKVNTISKQLKWEMKWEFAIKFIFECILSLAVVLPLHFTHHDNYVALVVFIQSFAGIWYLLKDRTYFIDDELDSSDIAYNAVEVFFTVFTFVFIFEFALIGLWLGTVYIFELERQVVKAISFFY